LPTRSGSEDPLVARLKASGASERGSRAAARRLLFRRARLERGSRRYAALIFLPRASGVLQKSAESRSVIASIPSPDRGTIDLGPFVVHMYGLMLLVAIAACVALTGVRYVRRGGDWDLVLQVAVWGVAAGIVGARLYHDLTSWDEVPDPKWQGVFEVWKGGLGVWGGIFFGCIAGWIVVKRSGRSTAVLADAAAPGILLAQGIGRIGNWFNQELYGKPTDVPWALEIDPAHRPP